MFNYIAFGLNISSEIELPGMIKSEVHDKPDIKISFGKVKPLLNKEKIECNNYQVNNQDIYLWWEDIGKIKISNGNRIKVDLENYDKNQIIPTLLGPVMALILHQRGFLVLHGSSIKVNNEAVAFLGNRGNGKSTTAINLYKKNYSIVTDDILAINFDEEGLPYIYPGYPHVRLSKDSYNYIKDETNILTPIRTLAGKVFCDTSRGFTSKSIRLKKIYLLKKGTQTRISTLNSQKNLIDLINHSVANQIFQINDQASNLTQCGKLINKVIIHRLEITHSFKDISELINLIEDDL
jgi:hypothetical protein